MLIISFVVEHCPSLDGLLRNCQRDVNHTRFSRGGFDRQLKRVEGVAGITTGDVRQMLQGVFICLDGSHSITTQLILHRPVQENQDVFLGQGFQFKDA